MTAHHHIHHHAAKLAAHVTKTPIPKANIKIGHFWLTWHEQVFLLILAAVFVLMILNGIRKAVKRRRRPRQRNPRTGYGQPTSW